MKSVEWNGVCQEYIQAVWCWAENQDEQEVGRKEQWRETPQSEPRIGEQQSDKLGSPTGFRSLMIAPLNTYNKSDWLIRLD